VLIAVKHLKIATIPKSTKNLTAIKEDIRDTFFSRKIAVILG
jgi:hypothetical protein